MWFTAIVLSGLIIAMFLTAPDEAEMTEQQREALKELAAAYEQQRNRNPLKDHETIAVYYGALRRLVDAHDVR